MYENIKKRFFKIAHYLLSSLYNHLGTIEIYGKNNLEEANKRARVVIATTHSSIKRSIPIGLALEKQFYLIIRKDMGKWYLNKNLLDPFIRLLNGVWIEGNDSKFPIRDLEKIAEVIDYHKYQYPKYVLIAVSGEFNNDNPEEFFAKRGLGLAYKIRLKKNLEKRIQEFNSTIVPSVELNEKHKDKEKFIVIYGKPIDPNKFIIRNKGNIDFDYYNLTKLIQERIRKLMKKSWRN